MPVADGTTRVEAARRAVANNPVWYHTLELAPGVVTPGYVDLRATAPKVLPTAISGRALDVGTFDGFWAFELERRGAETVAIDVPALDAAEWPPLNRERLAKRMRDWDVELGRGFQLASEALGSDVRRVECPVYELAADRIGGEVDFVFSGAILLHLRDPVRALEAILGTLAPRGRLVILEPFSPRDTVTSPRRPVARFQPLETSFNWWYPNLAAIRAWVTAAGFSEVRRTGIHRPKARREMVQWLASFEAVR